ncbi:MAG: alpha-mannosidase [Bacillota bacterium]
MPYAKSQMETEIKRVITRVKEAVYTIIGQLAITAWVTPEPVPFQARMSGLKKSLQIGSEWGKLWDCAWFCFQGVIPVTAAGAKVVLIIDLGGEACVVDEDGCPVQGLTNANSEFDRALGEPGKRVVFFTERAKGGEKISLWADAGTNDLFGNYRDHGRVQASYIAVLNDQAHSFYYDLEFLWDLMQSLPEDHARRERLLFTLYDAAVSLKDLTVKAINEAHEIINPELLKQNGDSSLVVSALGNSHIDLAWLWPFRETVRKGARTFSTALMMMERYPEYIFGASQPQLYQWMKTYYPCLYQKIKTRVLEGRWEALGAMWVEADTNIPGGESLVRQILYGKRFFQKEFNQETRMAWLPDSFGFNGALPQLFKKSGLDFFCTTKLTWNQFNQLPHHTFVWKGIDGSGVLAHIPPEGTYNSSAAPRAVMKAEKNYRDKGVSANCLMLYGIGDGGGGPGEEHLEMLKRERNAAGLPPVVQETAARFFRRLGQNVSRYRFWQGELYLERHQGTYTSQARNKRYNRQMELALHDLEFLAAMAMAVAGEPYPAAEIEDIWKEVLLYQFHDILPGSAITRVYQETSVRYALIYQQALRLRDRLLQSLAEAIDTTEISSPVLVWNSTSWERQEWINVNLQWHRVHVPAMGYRVIDCAQPSSLPATIRSGPRELENGLLLVVLAGDGSVSRIYDKENDFEVLEPGEAGNRLAVYEDDGDAWDIPPGYADRIPDFFRLKEAIYGTDGPRAFIKQTYVFQNSYLEQELILTDGSRRIDFSTRVDWRERNKMLRTSFRLNVKNDEATCEIQFGNIRRPTHRNTTWDMAKYEIPAQKWVDLSGPGYGAALLNDCKYGYKAYQNTLDLNLLRSTTYPDPEADQGTHEFTYSLYPHHGNEVAGGVVRAGYELNIPLTVFPIPPHQGGRPSIHSFFRVNPANIIIETVKKAEDGGEIIVRLYESTGQSVKARLNIGFPCSSLRLVDLMESECQQPSLGSEGELFFKPFEIHTLKISI